MDMKIAMIAGILLLFASVSAFVINIDGDTLVAPVKLAPALGVFPDTVPRACDVTVSYAANTTVKVYMANDAYTGISCTTNKNGTCTFKFTNAQPRGTYKVKAGTAQASVALEPAAYCASNIKSFTITPKNMTLQAGNAYSFVAVATDAAGATLDIVPQFSLSNGSFGTLTTPDWLPDNEILFTGTKAGSADLTASYYGKTATAKITVVPSVCTKSTINSTLYNTYSAGSNATFAVLVTDEYGNPKAGVVGIEYLSPSGESSRLDFTANAQGIAQVTFPVGSKSGPASVKAVSYNLKYCPADDVEQRQFTVVAGMPYYVIVSPQQAVEDVGDSVAFTARVYDRNMNEIPGYDVAWATSNGTIATINDDGIATTHFPGDADVIASADYILNMVRLNCSSGFCVPVLTPQVYTITGTAHLSVNTGDADNIVLNPVAVELNAGDILQFTAVVYDEYGVLINNPALVWTANSGAITPSGLYSAPPQAGSDTVTVSYNGISESAQITVLPDVPMSIDAYSENLMPIQSTQAVYAEVRDQYNNPVPGVTVVFNYLAGDGYAAAINPESVTNESGVAEVVINTGDNEGAVMYSMTVDGTTLTDIDSFMLYIPNATVYGTVTDTLGDEVAGATVQIDGTAYSAVTDANGTYLISEVDLNGTYNISVSAAGYSTQRVETYIEKNHDYQRNFVVVPRSTVEGHVYDEAGQPVEQALVIVSLDGTEITMTTTGADGYYMRIFDVPAEDMYTINASAENYDSTIVSFPLAPKATQVIDIVLGGYDDAPPEITVISPGVGEGPYYAGIVVIDAIVSDAHYNGASTFINGAEEVQYVDAHITRVIHTTDYADGLVEVLIQATDTRGHTAQHTIPLLLDNVGPEAAFVDPTPAEMSERNTSFDVRVEATDETGVNSIDIFANGALVGTCPSGACQLTVDPAGYVGVMEVEAVAHGVLSESTVMRQFNITSPIPAASHLQVSAAPQQVSSWQVSDVSAVVLDQWMQPIEGVEVNFTSTCGGLSALSADTDATGTAQVEFSAAGPAVCTVTAVAGALSNSTDINVTEPVGLALLGGTITNSSGNGLEGAVVQIMKSGEVLFQVAAGAGGAYEISLPADTYDIAVTYPGYLPAREYGVAVADGATLVKDYTLTKMSRISGTVTNETSDAVEGATVNAYRNAALVATTATSATGTYELTVPAGVYTVEITHPDYTRSLYTLYVATSSEAVRDVTLYR